MKEIKPYYVDFNTAKLLKEKGFDYPCFSWYSFDDKKNQVYTHNYSEYKCECIPDIQKEYIYSNHNESFSDGSRWVVERFSRPEQWLVCEWLRLEHGIWVYVLQKIDCGKSFDSTPYFINNTWEFHIDRVNSFQRKGLPIYFEKNFYNTPQEAYSAAFDHILKEVI
jgi:hypothetical protein